MSGTYWVQARMQAAVATFKKNGKRGNNWTKEAIMHPSVVNNRESNSLVFSWQTWTKTSF